MKVEIEPTTGALMEWFNDLRVSHVGFVERVSPSGVITMRTVSTVPSGTSIVQVFTERAWKELRPVFTRLRV